MSTKQISVKPLGNYEISQRPRTIKMITSDNLATITAAGYITTTDVQNLGGVFGTDVWEVIYSYDVATDSGTLAYFTTDIAASVVTLNIWENPGNVLLPVVDGDFAIFNRTEGQVKDAGYSPTDPAKTKVVMADAATVANHIMVSTDTAGTVGNKTGTAINDGNLQAGRSGVAGALISYSSTASKGYLQVQGVANAGDTAITLSNVSMGQATTINVTDPGASTGYLNVSTVSASTTPVGAFLTKNIALTAAALAASGHVTIQAGSGTMQFKVRDIKVNYSAAGLSGGGGDRLVQITDGTTVYNDAGITAALLGTPVNTVWGGTGNPLPGTVAADTSTVAGATLYAVYAGGAADYTTGTVNITVALERVA